MRSPRLIVAVLVVFVGGIGLGTLIRLVSPPAPAPAPATGVSTAGNDPTPMPSAIDPGESSGAGPTDFGSNVLLDPPVGPAPADIPSYASPHVDLPPNLDPGLATRGPRPTLHTLASVYQYGDPTVIFGGDTRPDEWRLAHPDPGAIAGYANDISVTPGSNLGLSLAGRDPWTDLDVFRMGIGDARHLLHESHLDVQPAIYAAPDPSTGRVDERWPVSTTLHIDEGWRSGVYLVKLTGSSGGQSYVLFIVRPPHPGPFTVVIPTMTYEAYNDYGGTDFYGWPGHAPARAFEVSYNRPFVGQFGAALFFRLDFPLVVWLEDHGYAPDYVADIDLALDPSLLAGVHTLAFSGHSEYWTGGMRDSIEAAAKKGLNLAFFGANQAFWQTRLASDSRGDRGRVLVCYKSTRYDPIAATTPADATVRFEEPPVNRPPRNLMGEKYGGIVLGVSPMRIGPGIRVFAPDIGLDEGDLLPGLIGEEVDELHHGFRGMALGQTPMTVVEHPQRILVGASLWINQGYRVFDAGTFDYSWGLDPRYAAALPGFNAKAFGTLTTRVLAWLGAIPAA